MDATVLCNILFFILYCKKTFLEIFAVHGSSLTRSRDRPDRFVVVFSVFIFLDALQSDYNNTTVMFVGINMFLVLLKAHFNPRPTTRPEMTLSQALNIFVPAKINSLVYLLSRDVVTSDVQFIATFGLHIASFLRAMRSTGYCCM